MFDSAVSGVELYHTYLLTPWSRVLLEKPTVSAASQEIPRIFGTRKFITVLTSARHLSLSWANFIQSPQPSPTSWRSILILSSHLRLGLPSGLFPSGFPIKTLYTPLLSLLRATCPAHLILPDFIIRTILGLEYRLLSSSLCNFLHSLVSFVPLRPKYCHLTPCSQTPSAYVPLSMWATRFYTHTKQYWSNREGKCVYVLHRAKFE